MLQLLLICFLLFHVNVYGYLDRNGLCSQQERTCSQECRAVADCSRPGVRPFLLGCSGESPFCHRGRCTNIYQPDCNHDYTPIFECSEQDGTFPDPIDCTRFHICLRGIAYNSDCGNLPGLVYNTKTHSCVRESNENRCGRIDCHNKTNIFATYSTDSRYATLCVNSMPSSIFRCPHRYEFNTKISKCEFKCPAEGLFPDYDETPWFKNDYESRPLSARYFECSLTYGINYIVTRRNCPNDEFTQSVFDPKLSECVYNGTTPIPPTQFTTTSFGPTGLTGSNYSTQAPITENYTELTTVTAV